MTLKGAITTATSLKLYIIELSLDGTSESLKHTGVSASAESISVYSSNQTIPPEISHTDWWGGNDNSYK